MSILIKGIPLGGYEISIMKDGERYRARVDGIWCEVEEIPATDTDSDTISRQQAIEALHTWFRNGFDEDRWWNSTHVLAVIEGLPPAQPEQLGTNLAEVGTDCISRRAAIERAIKEHDFFRGAVTVSDKARRDELLNVMCWLGELPPAQPAQPTPDQNGDLWITVPDIDKVTCIYVQESKSKFCRIFYEER